MVIVLFDWKSATACKKVGNALLTRVCLFDGYLTESTSFPYFTFLAYLIGKSSNAIKVVIKNLRSVFYLFDCYLIKPFLCGRVTFHKEINFKNLLQGSAAAKVSNGLLITGIWNTSQILVNFTFTQFCNESIKGKMWQLFGKKMDEIISELNEVLEA